MKKTMSLSLVILALYIVPAFSMEKKEGELVLSDNPHLKELYDAFSHTHFIDVANSDAWKRAQEFVPKENAEDATPKKPTLIVQLHNITQQSIEVVTSEEEKGEIVIKLDELSQCIPTILAPAAQRAQSTLEYQLKSLASNLENKQAEIKKHRDALTQALAEEKELKEKSEKTTVNIKDIAVTMKLFEEVQIKNKTAAEATIKATKERLETLTIEKNTKETKYNSVKPEDITAKTHKLKEEIDKLTEEINEFTANVASMEKTVENFGQPPKGLFSMFS